jgi:hypothetical protein
LWRRAVAIASDVNSISDSPRKKPSLDVKETGDSDTPRSLPFESLKDLVNPSRRRDSVDTRLLEGGPS